MIIIVFLVVARHWLIKRSHLGSTTQGIPVPKIRSTQNMVSLMTAGYTLALQPCKNQVQVGLIQVC